MEVISGNREKCYLSSGVTWRVTSVIVAWLNDRSMEGSRGWRTGCEGSCTHEAAVIQRFVCLL